MKGILYCKDASEKWSSGEDEQNGSTNGSCYA